MIPVQVHGVHFRVSDEYPEFWERVNRGTWEPETFSVLDRCVTEETTVLDVGAWIGPTVLYAASRTRFVYAFKPDTVACEVLSSNLQLNPGISNVEVVCAGVHKKDGEIRMGAPWGVPGDSMSSTLFADAEQAWTVPALRLDRFLREREITGPVFIKMDVEGHEFELLPALLKALSDYLTRDRSLIVANRSAP